MNKIGRPCKWSQDVVEQIRHARFVEKRKIDWISEKFEIPVDTVRDYIYRGKRSGKTDSEIVSKVL